MKQKRWNETRRHFFLFFVFNFLFCFIIHDHPCSDQKERKNNLIDKERKHGKSFKTHHIGSHWAVLCSLCLVLCLIPLPFFQGWPPDSLISFLPPPFNGHSASTQTIVSLPYLTIFYFVPSHFALYPTSRESLTSLCIISFSPHVPLESLRPRWLLQILYGDHLHKIHRAVSKLPGRPSHGFFLGNLPDTPRERTLEAEHGMRILEKYGSEGLIKFLLGPLPIVSIVDPDYAREILSSSRHISKGDTYFVLLPWLGTGLLTSTGAKWKERRRMATPAFHFHVLRRFIEVMNEQVDVLVEVVREKARRGLPINIFKSITLCALDIICETAMGRKVDAQLSKGDNDYVSAVVEMSNVVSERIENPLMVFDFIFNLSPLGRRHSATLKTLHGFTTKVIKERREELKSQGSVDPQDDSQIRPAFLDILLQATTEDGTPLKDHEIREEVDTFMFEGISFPSYFLTFFPPEPFWSIPRTRYHKCLPLLDSLPAGIPPRGPSKA